MFKQNDKDYKILFIRGLIDYNENFSGCLSKLDEIAKDIEEFIPSNTKEFVKSKSSFGPLKISFDKDNPRASSASLNKS